MRMRKRLIKMGCGVQKASTGSIRKADPHTEEVQPQSSSSSPVLRRHTDDFRSSTQSGYSRFTRRSEVVDYLDRDTTRPSRNSEMWRAYRTLGLHLVCQTSEIDEEKSYKTKPPAASLQLEYVYGYKCFMATQNLFYAGNGDLVVYPCAALVIVLDKTSNSQRFLGAGNVREASGHSDDILALTMSRNREYIATGEIGANPLICVWKVGEWTRPVKTIEQGANTAGVRKLAFSQDAKMLLAIDQAPSQHLRVYDWKAEDQPHFSDHLPQGPVLGCSWSAKGSVFCTVSPVCFWTKATHGYNRTLCSHAETMNAVDWLSTGHCVTGGASGALYLWSEHKIIKTVQVLAHNTPIHALTVVHDSILTGGEDNTVHLLDATFKELRQVDVPMWPRSLDVLGDTILCGTVDGSIQEFKGHQRFVLMESHSEGELWSVALDSHDPRMLVSTGDDNKIKCWDLSQRRCVSTGIIEAVLSPLIPELKQVPRSQQSRALCISPKGQIAVGHNDGHVTIRMGLSQLNNILAVLTDAQDWIQVLCYSQSAAYLAVGSHDTVIYIYDVNSHYKLFFKLVGHSSAVVSLDWSSSGTLLMSSAQDGELCYWEIESEQKLSITDARVMSETWASWTSASGWPVRGVNQMLETPEFVTSLARSQDQKYVAVGNAWGLVELYGYPNGPGSHSNVYRAHSYEVTSVLWTAHDELITTGGCDLAIMQWRLVEK